ncbi:4753_t:CDS:2 [Ambispora gerdemannii]|uniref:4753_t:CDS:1 n=1 Tax=Ambispora gerdemannii TaxID=144530 RepID=A0A9N9G7T6_9GLOM|nr:4753_t:CDS:2 [Ambispora gerdemannii]
MNICTTCRHKLPAEAFLHKGKVFKTCSNCLIVRSRKRAAKRSSINDQQLEREIEVIEKIFLSEVVDYVTSKATNLEHDNMLSFDLCIELDDVLVAAHDAKNMVKLIVDEIEGFDGYDWVFTTGPEMSLCHREVSIFYLACSQCRELEREYKESNRKRMTRFDCHGKLTIHIDMPAREAMIGFHHNIQHEKPVDITTPPEVKREIMQNLHMDPVQLRTHLCQMFDVSLVTAKQIYYWWSTSCQHFYKSDEDHVVSARHFLKGSHTVASELCFDWSTDLVTVIGFTTPLLAGLLPLLSIHCDATYKTVKERFELYGIISNIEGAGFPVTYLILNTTKTPNNEEQTGLRTTALKAIKEKLKSRKRIHRNQYQSDEAVTEFDFIDPTFKPDLERIKPEYYIICSPNLRDKIIDLIRKHFNMHSKIPINAAGRFLTADEIRKSAVHEMYDFCAENDLVLLWTYLWSAWYKMSKWELTGSYAIFQQGYASIHTAGKINWPANSSDLSPIENIWKILKDNIKKMRSFRRLWTNLKVALKMGWEKIDVAILERYWSQMECRLHIK